MYKRNQTPEIYLIEGFTDFRCGIDTLCYKVKTETNIEVTSNSVFIFCSKRRDRLKMLYWGGAGFWLITYRLEEGKFKWFKQKDIRTINQKQLSWLLDGLEIEPKNYIKEVVKTYQI